MALPRKGLSGVEKKAETRAWTSSMAESGRPGSQGALCTVPPPHLTLTLTLTPPGGGAPVGDERAPVGEGVATAVCGSIQK